jgi:hypothetical protein
MTAPGRTSSSAATQSPLNIELSHKVTSPRHAILDVTSPDTSIDSAAKISRVLSRADAPITTRPHVSIGPDHIVATSMIMSSSTIRLLQLGHDEDRALAVDSIADPQ